MKHIKIFEGFDTNNNPTSITLEILPGFYNRMKESNGTVTDGSYGYPDPKNIQLFDGSIEENILNGKKVCIKIERINLLSFS